MADLNGVVGHTTQVSGELMWPQLIATLQRSAWVLLAAPALAAVLGFTASYLVEPKYRVEAVLLPQQGGGQQGLLSSLAGQFGGLAALAGVDLAGSGNKYEAIEVLRSRTLAEEFIRSRDLLPVLFAEDWDAGNRRWRVKDERDIPSLADGVREFDRHVRSVTEDRRTGLVILSVTWRDAEVAADWANDLVRRANAQMRSRTVAESRRSLEFLSQRAAAEESVAVRAALYEVVENQVKSLALASAREDFAFRVIDAAAPPDPDDFWQPRRALFAAVGGGLGLLMTVLFLLVSAARQPASGKD